MTSTSPAVEAKGLRRRYGSAQASGFTAVRGLDLTVRRGELFALLGTNGAGKTSTMELIEGLARPTAGTVTVLGHDPFQERAALRPRIGIMLQEGGFPGDLTVAETVTGWAALSSTPRPVAQALDLVGLGGRAAVRVKQLSGGEKRRLDLAVALIGRPEVLFLDEPSTGLDPQARAAVWELVRELRAEGTTILLTTHYLEEAEQLADRLAIMHQGRVVTTGTVAEVIADRPARISFELPEQPSPPCCRCPAPRSASPAARSACAPPNSSAPSPNCSAGPPPRASRCTGWTPAAPRWRRPSWPSPPRRVRRSRPTSPPPPPAAAA